MRIPDEILEEISRRVDIVDLVGRYVSLKRSGTRYVGLCPFHNEKTPSFSVNPDIGAFYCFGCQRGGGAFQFLMEAEGLSFPEAARALGQEVGVEVDQAPEDPAARHRRALSDLYNRVAKTFSHFLIASQSGGFALEALRQRGVNEEIIEKFQLGYAPQDPFWLHGFLLSKNYSAEFLGSSGLFTQKNPQRALFADRIMFPISDRRGDVIAFGGRLLRGDGPKYINSPETPLYRKREALYGIHLALQPIRKQQQVVICEGYMDVIALHQSGVEHSVAPLGTAFTTEQAVFLKRYAETATLLFDADRAGVQASRKTAEVLEQQGVAPAVVVLDEGQDPADLMLSGGSQAVLNAVSSPLPILEFLVQKGRETGAGSSPVAKERISHELFGYIELIGSEVKREESLRHVSDLLGVDFAAVHTDFLQWRRTAASSSKKKQETRREVPSDSTRSGQSRLTHDLFLMLATVHSRDHYPLVRKWVQPEDLEDDDAREVYLALEESFRRGETSLELLLQRITKPTVMKLVQERVATGEFEEQTDAVVHDTINAIRRRSILKQLAAVERELRRLSASSTGSSASERELLTEKMSLDRELQKIKGDGE